MTVNINLLPPQKPQEIQLSSPEPAMTFEPVPSLLPEERIQERAEKINLALIEDSPGIEMISHQIRSGEESMLSESARLSKELELRAEKTRLIEDTSKTRRMSADEIQWIYALPETMFTDDATALYEKYSDNLLKGVLTSAGNRGYEEALNGDSERTNSLHDVAKNLITSKELLQKYVEEEETDWDKQSWFSTIWNYGEKLVPLLSDFHKMDYDKSWMVGKNVQEQIDNLRLLAVKDPDEYIQKVKEKYIEIKASNPVDALEWLKANLAYSRISEGIDTAFQTVDVAGIAGGVLSSVVKKAVRGAAAAKAQRPRVLEPVVAGRVVYGKELPQIDFSSVKSYSLTDVTRDSTDPLSAGRKRYTVNRDGRGVTTLEISIDNGHAKIELLKGHDKLSVKDYRGMLAAVLRKHPEITEVSGMKIGEKGGWRASRTISAADRVERSSDVTFENSLKDIVKAASTTKMDGADFTAATGNIELSATVNALKRIETNLTPDAFDPEGLANVLHRSLNSAFNPRAWFDKGSRLSRELTDRIVEGMNDADSLLIKAIHNPSMAVRLTSEALKQGIQLKKAEMKALYTRANDGVIDTMWEVIEQDKNAAHVNFLRMYIGKPDATAFASIEDAVQAANHKYFINPKDFDVRQQGDGFYITVLRPVDETDPAVRAMLKTKYNQTPQTLANTFLHYLRNPDDKLSKFSVANRKAVTHVSQEIQDLFQQIAEPLGALSKKQINDLTKMMELNREAQVGGKRGKFYDSSEEFEIAWHNKFNEYPDEKLQQAYMITRYLSDADWMVKSLSIYRDMSRQGIVNFSVRIPKGNFRVRETDTSPEMTGAFKSWKVEEGQNKAIPTETKEFYGKPLLELPNDGREKGIYVLRGDESEGTYYAAKELPEEVKDLVDNHGFKITQIADPSEDIFGAGEEVNFVIARNVEQSPLDINKMLPYQPGFHVDYAPGFYAKQPNFGWTKSGKRIFRGATSIAYFVSQAEAKRFYKAFDEARLLLKADNHDELKRFLPANLPHTYEEFTKLFNGGEAALSLDEPIMYTRSGQGVDDAARTHHAELRDHFKGVKNTLESPYNLMSSVNRQYTQEKNLALPSVKRGSEGEPLYKFTPAKLINPVQSLHRNMHSMIRQRTYDNYQYQQLESFVEEFSDMTKWDPNFLRQNPLVLIKDPRWQDKVDTGRLQAAKNVHKALVSLLGVRSELNQKIDWALNKVVDSVTQKYGDKKGSYVHDIAITKLTDPTRYARAIVFHKSLGMFNPVQYFLQGQSVLHAVAVTGNPKRSYQAWAAGWLQRRLSLTSDPKVIESFAEKATKWGWTKEEFLESYNSMRASGLWHVEGEVVSLDDVFQTKLFRNSKTKKVFLDKGPMFFREGERLVRLNAWNTAYLEFKRANPGKVIGARERNEILRRYDDLAINMTRSSSAQYQQGILSLPTQFTSYYARMMEQMLSGGPFRSGRLTWAEKSRLTALYGAMYGIPTGLAVGLPMGQLWPFGEDIKQAGLEKGIPINEGMNDVILNGLIASAIEMATGQEYNFSERYGPGGLTFLKEALAGDKSALEVVLGPSGSLIQDVMNSSEPLLMALVGAFQEGDNAYPLIPEDFLALAREISSVNQGWKMIYALNTGRFISKNENFTGSATSFDAIMQGVFGLEPRAITDTYVRIESQYELRGAQKHAQDMIIKNYRRALKAPVGSDDWNKYMKAVKMWVQMGGFRPDQMSKILHAAFEGDTSMVDKVWKQWIVDSPQGSFLQRFDERQEDLKRQGK